ncbi:hypothetical protein DXK93_27745, partial [Achromobacter sp. K91]
MARASSIRRATAASCVRARPEGNGNVCAVSSPERRAPLGPRRNPFPFHPARRPLDAPRILA